MENIQHYFFNEKIDLEDLKNGITRKILAHNESLMIVEVNFEKGAVGQVHEHFHEQISYVVSGAFEFNIGGDKQVIKTGDTVFMEKDVPHGAVCLEAGVLLDIFTPERKDFL
jgi:quercetin dioxygenase-like cupin family protein